MKLASRGERELKIYSIIADDRCLPGLELSIRMFFAPQAPLVVAAVTCTIGKRAEKCLLAPPDQRIPVQPSA